MFRYEGAPCTASTSDCIEVVPHHVLTCQTERSGFVFSSAEASGRSCRRSHQGSQCSSCLTFTLEPVCSAICKRKRNARPTAGLRRGHFRRRRPGCFFWERTEGPVTAHLGSRRTETWSLNGEKGGTLQLTHGQFRCDVLLLPCRTLAEGEWGVFSYFHTSLGMSPHSPCGRAIGPNVSICLPPRGAEDESAAELD